MIHFIYSLLRLLFLCSLGLTGFLLSGFLAFCFEAALYPISSPTLPPQCEGLVVLTGGEHRITTALHLLQNNPSSYLLISGVAPHTQLRQIVDQNMDTFDLTLTKRITLGYRSISTVGNARETRQWAISHHLHSIALITSNYHMQRAILEFHYISPDLDITPYPVKAKSLSHLWNHRTWIILIREYIKLIGSLLRLIVNLPAHPYDLIS